MAKKYVNASKNAGLKTNRITKRPVTTFVNASKRDEDKNQGGILGGTGYLLGNLGLGLAGVGEGVSDILSAGGDLLRGDTEMAKYRFKDNQTDETREKLEKSYNPGTVMKLAGDVSSGIGNSLTFMIPYVGPYLAGAGYVGMGISDAAAKTGDVGAKELAYGAASGALEFGLDALTGGAGKAAKNLGASITRKLGREAAQAGAKATGKLAGKSFGKSVLVESLKGAGGEALEESLSELIDPQLQKLFGIDKNAETSLKNVAYAGLIGAISGGLMTAGPAAINYKNAASVGKQIRESGETEDFIQYTNDVLKAAQRTQTKYATAAENAKAPADASVVQKFNAALNPLSTKNKSNRAQKRVEAIADTVQKNLNTLQQYRQNPTKTPKELEIADAVLGELRGNVFLLENASLLEYYEDSILDLSDEDKQDFVDQFNRRAKANNAEKSDYTVEDLNNNTDGMRTAIAAWRVEEDEYGDLFAKARKATQTAETTAQPAQEAAQATEGAKAEEAPAQPANAVKKRFVGNGEVRIAGGKQVKDLNLSDEQYTAYKAAEILAPTTGADIELHETLDKDGKTANGYYDPATNTIHININAKRGSTGKQIALYTLGHETTHYIREWSPAKYDELASFVMDKLGGDTDSLVSSKADFLRTISDYKNKTDAEILELAREEVVADGMELILTDGKVLDELARTDRTLWETIKEWIEDTIAKIREAFANLNQASKTAQTLKETLDSLEEIERLFTEGVKDAGEQTRTAREETTKDSGDKKYSVSENDVTESSAFKRWFGDSKVVNRDGTPMLLYHQTENGFTVFDPRHKGAGTTDDETPFGIFMKPTDQNIGLKGQKQMPLYAKIENPLRARDIYDLVRQLRLISPEYAKLKGKISALSVEYQVKIDNAVKAYKQYIQEYKKEHPNANRQEIYNDEKFRELFDEDDKLVDEWSEKANKLSLECKEEITKALKENEYDGVFIEEDVGSMGRKTATYIALNPNQVKSATENLGTFDPENPDIRYSIDETAESPDVEEIETDTEQELTDRDMLLAMAEQLVGNEQEAKILADYKAKYDEQKARQNRWNELNEQMQELQSTLWTSDKSTERSEAAKKLQGIYQEMGKISEKMADVDRKMFEITNMKVIRNLLKREYVKARDVQKEKYKRIFEQRTAAKETTEARRSVRRIYNRVNRLMFSPNRKRGVPYEMQPIVAEALKTANMNAEELQKLADLEERLSKIEKEAVPDEQKIANLEKQIENQEKKTATIKEQTQFMIDLFEKTKEIKEGVGANVFDETALKMLKKLQKEIGNSSIRNMKKEQLVALKDFYDMLYERITNANKTFATEKALDIDELGTKANNEVVKSEPLKVYSPTGKEWKGMTWARKYFWANMKPLTVFEALGSETLQDLFQKVLDGEDVWARDLMEAYEFLEGVKKKYGYNKWDLTKRSEVKTANGQTVSLTLGEKMSLYAYMFRDQAEKHLSDGGFTFAPDAETIEEFQQGLIKYEAVLNDQTQYKMRKEDIAVMSASLTEEQKNFAKDVQEYITSLGKKGNEVSKKLYGINLFNEQFYFPIRSNRDYLAESTGKSGDPNIKSRGTFKETVPDAGNPIVLEDFMKVVSQHINNMATYHAFVLPIEDLTRVWNYTPANIKRDENGKAILDKNGMPVADDDSNRSYNSLKAEITKKYGKQANEYILNLIRDLNGGARRDAAASILDKGITAFKRAATSMSLSTIIQQPTSIFRAMSIIDKKYFAGAEMVKWEEIKKLAPVAFIKEMGGHDTSTGARTDEFLNAKEYDNTGDKIKAMVKPKAYGGDPQARAETFGWLTGKADEVAWRYMFGACINEQADKLGKPKNSKEVKEAAAKRFTEVVRKTQVYDSTLTRSQFMRSKDNLMKIVTSFGAEPTTVMSMLADGIIKFQRGDKIALRTIAGAVALSVLANALASSVIYAMRDNDEDETYAEKYVQSLTSEVIEGINPLEYLPIARDVMSLFKGYEIERTDMTLVSNLFEQVELITSSKRSLADKIFGVSGAVSAFFGVPVTNIYRDAKGMLNTALGFFDPESQTGAGFKHAVGDSVRGQFSLISKLIGAESGNAYELYQAYVRGDTAHYNRVRARYESPQAAELALRQALRDNDPRIAEAAQARISGELDVYESIVEQIEKEGVFDRNIVIRAVNNEINAINNDAKTTTTPKEEDEEEDTPEQLYKSSDLNAALERGDEDDFLDVYASLLSYKMDAGKTETQAKSAVKSSITSYWKKRYLAAWEANDTKEIKRIQAILLSTGLYGSQNEVAETGRNWIRAYAESKSK